MSDTITRSRRDDTGGQRRERWYLTLALDADRPLEGSLRIALEHVDRVSFGRSDGEDRRLEVDGRDLALACPDRRMSGDHAELIRAGAAWRVSDRNSKNGVFVDGSQVKGRELADGDVLELGHTFFVIRQSVAPPSPLVADALVIDPAGGPATLNVDLAERLEAAARIARSRAPMLLAGESGTGKEVLARSLHRLSDRGGKLVAVNCAELPRDLIASELFGHRRGAFSGAVDDRPGLIAAAAAGTLFLDEVGEIPEPVQAALLRALQERQVRPVGATEPIDVDFRLLAATNKDLEAAVAAGAFRGDLHARIAGFSIELPPLRERVEDIGLLVADLLPRVAADRAPGLRFSYQAARALLLHRWPSNVRELEHALSTAVALVGSGDSIELDHLPPALGRQRPPRLEGDALQARVEELLREHAGNVSAVSRALGISRVQIYRILKRLGVEVERFR